MFNPKITEGPWKWVKGYVGCESPLVGKDNTLICHFGIEGVYEHCLGTEPEEEDMRAIAAVPELLEVYRQAKELVDGINGSGDPSYADENKYTLERMIKKLEDTHGEADNA